ncbi:MAG: TetR/AcrR family transcriptional regulator [Mogibacterium sp.]|nr:TetR/AcrR family transcriptional regulator [Mogibacterium sp.]
MDRRQKKTRTAIFQAFNKLLKEKHFNNITVQEILNEANVGRSTFYSHFETKDALLKEMCTEIFDHIFSHAQHSETSHDFSSSDDGLRETITHLLYHLKDNAENVPGIISGESSDLFMHYFKEYLTDMFRQYPDSMRQDVPREFALNHLVGSLAEGVKWWTGNGMDITPERFTDHYLKMTGLEAEDIKRVETDN